MSRNKWTIAAAGILISLVFLWLAFRNLQPAQVWAIIQQSNGVLLLLAAAWYFVSVAAIAARWQFLLNTSQRIPLRALTALVCIGYAGNNIYPFRSGELLRIWLLQRNHGVSFARGTTTVVVERVFDGLVLLTFIVLALLVSDVPSQEVRMIAALATPIFLVALAVFFLLAAQPNLLRRIYGALNRLLPERLSTPLASIAEDVISGLSGLRSPADLAGAVVSSYATWVLHASVFWITALAFNMETSFMTMLLIVGAVNLAGLIPASPGQFGVFESLAAVILVASGLDQAQAVAFALAVHMVIWLPVTLVGLGFLLQQGLSISAITQAQQLEQKQPDSAI